jgi:Fe-S cluster assembly scaffold protein SufB
MKKEEQVGMKGWIKIDHFDRKGSLIESIETPNVVTNVGFTEVAGLFCSDVAAGYTAFDYIGVGTGVTAATYTNTILAAAITDSGLARAAATGTLTTENVANDTAQFVHQFAVTDTQAVTESAVFNAASSGTMLCRQTFSAINVANGDTLQITWKVTVSRP